MIDFILVSNPRSEAKEGAAAAQTASEHRRVFETNLSKEGLLLETLPEEPSGLVFVKIHAPLKVLKRYAEILKLRLPMKKVREARGSRREGGST